MTEKKTQTIEQTSASIKEALLGSEKPLLLAHIRPDGDAIGSMVGLALALRQKGKKPQLVISGGLPQRFNFVTGSESVTTKINNNHDLVVSLDCANYARLSSSTNPSLRVDINIDHHITNEKYAELNFVLPNYAATTAILAKFLEEWDYKITTDVADALLMGMITDTIGFRTDNVNPEYLHLTANLLNKGANLAEMYHQGLTIHSATASKIWGYALSRLVVEDTLAWTTILIEDRKKAAYNGMDDADLTNHLSSLENIDISVLFNEQKGDKVKVSWRSNDKYDVTVIAMIYKGGGHPRAAGATVDGKLDEVIECVLGETRKVMKGKNKPEKSK